MRLFKRSPRRANLEELFGLYAETLVHGAKNGGSIFRLIELPADKALMKAVLLQKAYETGPEANQAMRLGFMHLSAFQEDTSELTGGRLVADEMGALMAEWDARVCFAEGSH